MAYDDTKWGGFAKIIVDTSTMQVGDKVRVKSMTTGTNYDKTVATVGTPLIWETDIFKDYVKICMVQTINDTPTEIGGVYRECDYGQTLFINVLDKTTLQGIQGILNAHQETSLLNIGDEVTIRMGGSDWVMQVGAIDLYDTHEVILVSKNIYAKSIFNTTRVAIGYGSSDTLKPLVDSLYNSIDEKEFIKEVTRHSTIPYGSGTTDTYYAKIWIPSFKEVTGIALAQNPDISSQTQFPIFTTQSSRIKTFNGVSHDWGTSDLLLSDYYWYVIVADGSYSYDWMNNAQHGVLPCFTLKADS